MTVWKSVNVLVLDGINALPDFRRRKLLQTLQQIDPHITDVAAEYVHFADSASLNRADRLKLDNLLEYGEPFNGEPKGQRFLVVPRPGTISPWSSKATDIAHNSGLAQVRRLERGEMYYVRGATARKRMQVAAELHDRMTEVVLPSASEATSLFRKAKPQPVKQLDILTKGKTELRRANRSWGLALAEDEIDYLDAAYKRLKRNPTDAELMMFGVVNSEHCRHKIFNADWIIEGQKQPKSLFKMIKNTFEQAGDDVLSAYSDNAAVIQGPIASTLLVNPKTHAYGYVSEPAHLVIKVETHNHPTAIAPVPGAATGAGGEIRDEAATGRGARSKMGLTGFSVSNLELPGAKQPWEKPYGRPNRIASALEIMIEGPLGGAAYHNEFGRVNLAGYFRTFQQSVDDEMWGYHKPIMLAGGLGNIRPQHVHKKPLPVGALLIVLGGPSMLIGLGGGAASSMQTGQSEEDLDFASVQRANAELERRTQEVINACRALGSQNPIISIHDVGAGGLSNALPELVHDSGLGANIELRDIPNAEPSLSPMQIWSNEAQERYVLGLKAEDLKLFRSLCERERCPFAVVGKTTRREQLVVHDQHFGNNPVDLPMDVLFGKPPKMTRSFQSQVVSRSHFQTSRLNLEQAIKRVLHMPSVASKKFLITIGDRTVGGLTIRDQMVGPWQVPVADVAVTATGFLDTTGEALAIGERAPVALVNSAAAARLAVGESITNIVAAPIAKLSNVKLSANWMAAAGFAQEDQHLFEAVKTLGEDFCPDLGLTIPVGKDSLSMRTTWTDDSDNQSVSSPVSVVISAFSPVTNAQRTLTPQLDSTEDSNLLLIDLGEGKNRMGGSALAQAYGQTGDQSPDIEPRLLKAFFYAIQKTNKAKLLMAYHDRSDGGLLTTLCEMAFASRSGLQIDLQHLPGLTLDQLFNEELGAVIQVAAANTSNVINKLKAAGLSVFKIGHPTKQQTIVIKNGQQTVYRNSRAQLESWWAETSYRIQKLRDNPATATEEYQAIYDDQDPGLSPSVNFSPMRRTFRSKPKVAIFREQGVNGQSEMAAAFGRAGFTAIDVHLHDLATKQISLKSFDGLATCGGFSYGDVLGAGGGWAKSILFDSHLNDEFRRFFERPKTFSLGVCNGCQMLSNLKSLIPGAESWPKFLTNKSERFEARLATVQVNNSPSVLLSGMAGSRLLIPVAHGEGRAAFDSASDHASAQHQQLIPLQYVDNYGQSTQRYPFNPNGSPDGIAALTTPDGRVTIMMPHPERAFLTKQHSWHPNNWPEDGPWLQLFRNARKWIG